MPALPRGRPRVWLDELEFARRRSLLIPRPPRCICGVRDYRLRRYPQSSEIYARCNACNAMYSFSHQQQRWRRLYSDAD